MLWTETESVNNNTLQSPLNSHLITSIDPLEVYAFPGNNSTNPQTIIFVDGNVSDAMTLLEGLQADVKVLLDPTRDGIAQITEVLGQYQDLTGVNIISHGNIAQLQLGNSILSANTLAQYAQDLQQWAASLDPDADILFHGCNVAAGEFGQAFANDVSELTKADVAASVDLTGNSALGGDWVLEYTTGSIETEIPLTDSPLDSYQGLLASLFTTQTPSRLNLTDGAGSAGDYELGMEFRSAKAGQISGIRYWKASSETGTHIGKIWSSTGTLLGSVTFTNETASGWQEQVLATPLSIQANTTYVVSVNANSYYVVTNSGLATTVTNGDLSAVADGSNGVYNTTPSNFPTQSYQNSNYFRDIVFTANSTPTNNPGTITVSGTPTQNQTLTASVADTDGLTGVTINYQWQQSSNNGTTWTNITGATNQTLTLGQAQVNNLVRARATYTDALGSGENITSATTSSIANVNDLGTVALTGTAAQGRTLTANVSDTDGTPATINYQWQQSTDNGTTWNNITGANSQGLALDSSYVGKKVRVNAIYSDILGGSENIFSPASNSISIPVNTLFTTQIPNQTNLTDGAGSAGDYELGMEFRSAKAGQIQSIRYYKASSEIGSHVGKIWSSTGTLLASVTFTNETTSGWQEQALATPLTIQANTTYVVSVNANSYYVTTNNGLASTLTNGDLSAVADGSNGVYNQTPGNFPTQSYQNSNYFRDVVFTPSTPPANNNPGTITVSGTATQNQTLTATVADTDGLTGATINYQWQQSSDNGTTWNNIVGATNQTLTLGQAQVNNRVRATATYTDALGSSENPIATATSSVINVNDTGTVGISGTPSQGNTLTANVSDADGLTSVTINYQWQQSSDNGNTWSNIANATNQTLNLDSSFVGKRVRVNAIYTDVLGTSENILSAASNQIGTPIDSTVYTMSVFEPTLTPTRPDFTDGAGSAGDYELGMKFSSVAGGQIQAIRYWKSPSETGSHVGKIWSSSGQLLASVTFTNETASGWQQQALATPLTIAPNTTYVVSVNTNGYYAITPTGMSSPIANNDLRTVIGSGVYNQTPDNFPTQIFNNENYFRDVVAIPLAPSATNNAGSTTIAGTVKEDETLTANVADADGVTANAIAYQWQQFINNTWVSIDGATSKTLTIGDELVGKQLRVRVIYNDALGNREYLMSTATNSVINSNEIGAAVISGSAAIGQILTANIIDNDGLAGVTINYQWQQWANNIWSNIAGATSKTLTLASSLLNQQVRATATYTDVNNFAENLFSPGATIAAQNPIVLENQNQGTTAWEITNQATNEIAGYASATSVNQGEILPIKVSLAQAGQYKIDVYRLGYYGGTGGRLMASSGLLNGVTQAGPTTDQNTRLVEYNWNTSYNLQIGNDWTSGLYIAKMTDITTGKESQLWFSVRDDDRPAAIGFQDTVTTYAAYNNYGGYSLYDSLSVNNKRAYKVSLDRPLGNNIESFNGMLTWEYNMVRWLESQGYDISYYSNLDVHTNPLQLYSQNTFLSVGHDEYWSMDMFDNVTKARDNGINLGFFSANTAYWRVRFEPSTTGQANRVMVSYKQDWEFDPVAQKNISAATTWFRSSQVNRPENSLLGVMYIGDYGAQVYNGFDFVVTNTSDPYYANTGLQNGDRLTKLVGYEWDAVVNNGFTPANLVILSQSTVAPLGTLPPLPPGTNTTIANAVRYTAASGAKVFSTGSVQWVWGLDSDGVVNPRTDIRAQQMTVNILKDMGALPQTPGQGIIV